MTTLISLMLGGAIGTIFRFLISSNINKLTNFPIGTLLVNLIGAILIGVIFGIMDIIKINDNLKHFLITGFLGALTTFSTFSMESANFIEQQNYSKAILYIFISNILCISLAFLSLKLIKNMFH